MKLPQWFAKPNDLQTEQDIKEVLEYEKVQLELLKKEANNRLYTPERLRLDLLHAELRVAQLEQAHGT